MQIILSELLLNSPLFRTALTIMAIRTIGGLWGLAIERGIGIASDKGLFITWTEVKCSGSSGHLFHSGLVWILLYCRTESVALKYVKGKT